MGTCNFDHYDSLEYYKFYKNDRDEDDFYDYREDVICSLNVGLERMAKSKKRDWYEDDDVSHYSNRNYPSRSVGVYRDSFCIFGTTWKVRLVVKIICGYYEGFTVDYDIEISNQQNSSEWFERNNDDIDDDLKRYVQDFLMEGKKEEVCFEFVDNAIDAFEQLKKEVKKLQEEVETVFKEL